MLLLSRILASIGSQTKMKWIWQQSDWPNFVFDEALHIAQTMALLQQSGRIYGRLEALPSSYAAESIADTVISEAIKTSLIEGEHLDRASVRSSVKALIGIADDPAPTNIDPRARGIATLLHEVMQKWSEPLTAKLLCDWQGMVVVPTPANPVLSGMYRTVEEVITDSRYGGKVIYEAVPGAAVDMEMARFLDWYNNSAPTPIKAAVAHLWFEAIHPFEDGNGRIGRAISDHAFSQSFGHPSITGISSAISASAASNKEYYSQLEAATTGGLHLDRWIGYFLVLAKEALDHTQSILDFVVAKTRFYEKYNDVMNARQHQVISRMFKEGTDGFEGGISAKKYMKIVDCSKATATRDLQFLLVKGAIKRIEDSAGPSTRYEISLDSSHLLSGERKK
ncbi:MAG: Fic family protein [Gammaproteobacteria bacterium]|nr:Fic family protein [Gammaproteobacteria bacterium]MYE29882.1 Fic family protein [Gammaproteobacteria bacterium]